MNDKLSIRHQASGIFLAVFVRFLVKGITKVKRMTAMMLLICLFIPIGTVAAQDGGGDDLGILDCYPPTAEYLQAVMPGGMPTFAFYNECGVLNLHLPFSLSYSTEMVAGAGLGDQPMAFNVDPYPVLTGSWNDTNPAFLNLSDDTYPGGKHGLELTNTTMSNVAVGLIHTYLNPTDNNILMGEPMRLLYQNQNWQVGQTVTLTQEIGVWRTIATLRLTSTQIVQAGLFQDADQVSSFTGRIQIDLTTIGYLPASAGQSILFVGCYESASDWFGNRVLFSFELESITVEQIN